MTPSSTWKLVKTCESDAIDAVPGLSLGLDMAQAKELLEKAGYDIVVDAGPLLVFRNTVKVEGRDECSIEATLYDTGRILMKTSSEEDAKHFATSAYSALGQ